MINDNTKVKEVKFDGTRWWLFYPNDRYDWVPFANWHQPKLIAILKDAFGEPEVGKIYNCPDPNDNIYVANHDTDCTGFMA